MHEYTETESKYTGKTVIYSKCISYFEVKNYAE